MNPADAELCNLFETSKDCRDKLISKTCALPQVVSKNWKMMQNLYKNWNPFCTTNYQNQRDQPQITETKRRANESYGKLLFLTHTFLT